MTRLPMRYSGYVIADSDRRGGKAGRGRNKTATVQVREPLSADRYLLRKEFRYTVAAEKLDREAAIAKAKGWIEAQE